MSGDGSRKRKKGYYAKASQGKRIRQNHYLDAGMKGFLITCNNREREAVREAYNVLNEYADDIYGPEQVAGKCDDGGDGDSEEDIETALNKEITAIKQKKHTQRRFQVVDSGAKNCVFIKTTIESPKLLIHKMLSDISETKQAKSRFIMRVHPVAATCKTDEEKLRELVESCLSEYMETGEAKTYCILIKVRNNTDFDKPRIFPIMRQVIQDMNPNHDFDDVRPDYVFSMDVIKNICCLSVMEDFYKFRKYNIQEVVKVTDVNSTNQQKIDSVTVDNIVKTGESEDNIVKTGESEDTFVKTGESEDNIVKTGESEDNIVKTGESGMIGTDVNSVIQQIPDDSLEKNNSVAVDNLGETGESKVNMEETGKSEDNIVETGKSEVTGNTEVEHVEQTDHGEDVPASCDSAQGGDAEQNVSN